MVVRDGRARAAARAGRRGIAAAKKFSGYKIIFKRTVLGVLKRFGPITFAYMRPGSYTSGIRNKNNIVSRNY